MRRRLFAIDGKHRHDQHQGPEAKHHFHFAQQHHTPACVGWVRARRSKNLVAKVCRMAMANSAAPISSVAVGITHSPRGIQAA